MDSSLAGRLRWGYVCQTGRILLRGARRCGTRRRGSAAPDSNSPHAFSGVPEEEKRGLIGLAHIPPPEATLSKRQWDSKSIQVSKSNTTGTIDATSNSAINRLKRCRQTSSASSFCNPTPNNNQVQALGTDAVMNITAITSTCR